VFILERGLITGVVCGAGDMSRRQVLQSRREPLLLFHYAMRRLEIHVQHGRAGTVGLVERTHIVRTVWR
jgi:hypothetical protein